MEDRARHPNELNKRCCHPVGNAAASGAAAKGRSAARGLSQEMQKLMALQLAANLFGYFLWVASGDNPI